MKQEYDIDDGEEIEYELMQQFGPRKVSITRDSEKTMEELGLYPRGGIVLIKQLV